MIPARPYRLRAKTRSAYYLVRLLADPDPAHADDQRGSSLLGRRHDPGALGAEGRTGLTPLVNPFAWITCHLTDLTPATIRGNRFEPRGTCVYRPAAQSAVVAFEIRCRPRVCSDLRIA